MKLVWCPETASKAYIDAVRSLSAVPADLEDANVAELVAAMAGGWKAQLVAEAPAGGGGPATSLALAAALRHTRGRRLLIAETEADAGDEEYGSIEGEGVDMVVVDMRRKDAGRVMREARAGPRGMVVVCTNADAVTEKRKKGMNTICASAAGLGKGTRVVRSAYLPIGRGVEILHVGVGKGPRLGRRRWFKHVDRVTGEEHLFRQQ